MKKPLFLSYMEEGEEDYHTKKTQKRSEHVSAFQDAESKVRFFFVHRTAVQDLIRSL